jgi:ribosome recycling factor
MRRQEKDAGVSADEFKRLEKQLQDLTDRYILQVDEIGEAKEKEVLQV